MNNNDIMISVKGLSKYYGTTQALRNVNLDIYRGRIVGLLGPNGCGKTTLIKLLANLLTQYEGSILIDGKTPGVETKKIISYLPDRNYLSDSWNANQAITFFKDFYDDFDENKARELINQLGINPAMKFKSMSKGTKEKLQLILVLSRKALIYLFDEPIAGVDPAARELIFNLILQNYNKEATVIISTHLIYDVEQILDDVIFINRGEIVRYGNVKEITETTQKSIEDLFKEEFRWHAN
jgi:ABC-2 type transport system ATP-binding protein